jgi:hypothetical protein
MLFAEFKKMHGFHRTHFLNEISNRALQNDTRWKLGRMRYSISNDTIQVQLRLTGFSNTQHINLDVYQISVHDSDGFWMCGPTSDCSIPLDFIEEILIEGKEVFSRA